MGLNPFRAGQCLSTFQWFMCNEKRRVSIPFEQGNVFRPVLEIRLVQYD